MEVLILWTKEKKLGIEPQCNVPAVARFEGAVTPVRFSGDKRWYPAKVLMMSADRAALDQREKEELAKMALTEAAQPAARKRKAASTSGKATEQQVARALGSKVPVVAHLRQAHDTSTKAKKVSKSQTVNGSAVTDRSVLALGKKSQPAAAAASHELEDDDDNAEHDADDLSDSAGEGSEPEPEAAEKWCPCKACLVLQKYDDAMYINFLDDILKLYSTKSTRSKKFLVLKAIFPGSKQTELVSGTGVHIKSSVKEEIKVDFKNKPSSLIREVLYELYGKEQFRVLNVTARGSKPGSYGIQEDVLKALVAFVNKNVDVSKAVTLKTITSTINKRAPEWRRGEASPASVQRKKRRLSSPSLKVTSTSPFKCTPLKSPKSVLGSPKMTPAKSAIKVTPLKVRSPDAGPKRQLFNLDGPAPAAGQPAATPSDQAAATPSDQYAASSSGHAPEMPAAMAGQHYPPGPYHYPQSAEGWSGWNYSGYGGYGPPPPYQQQPPPYNWNEQA